MTKLIPFLLPAVFLVGIVVYATVFGEFSEDQSRITGEYEAAQEIAEETGARLLMVVDSPPP